MKFPQKIITTNESETADLAKKFSEVLKQGDVVSLVGDLGVGKTFFVKRVLSAFGHNNGSSPTFAIVNVYENKFIINHFDFYRIKKIEELYDIGFDDYLNDEEAITFIEWADLYPQILPKHRYEIKIKYVDDNKREFIIDSIQ